MGLHLYSYKPQQLSLDPFSYFAKFNEQTSGWIEDALGNQLDAFLNRNVSVPQHHQLMPEVAPQEQL